MEILLPYFPFFSAGGILLLSLGLIFSGDLEALAWDTTWFALGGWELKFGFLIDAPARLLLFVVAFVGFLIHVFSLGYMADDSAKSRYFGGYLFSCFPCSGLLWLTTW